MCSSDLNWKSVGQCPTNLLPPKNCRQCLQNLPRQFTRRCRVNWRGRFCRHCLQFFGGSRFVGHCPTDFQFGRRRLLNKFGRRFARQCLANLKRHELFRRCLNNWRTSPPTGSFRQCLNNYLGRPSQEKPAHHAEIDIAEATTKAFGQITRKPTNHLFAILRPHLALLHKLHDAPPDFPIRRSEDGGIAALLEEARRQSARSVNAILTATYWEIGRRIVEFVQAGETRAEYGEEVLVNLSRDLTKKFGRGFTRDNLQRMKSFYQLWPYNQISATLARQPVLIGVVARICGTPSHKSLTADIFQTSSAALGICGTVSHKSADTGKLQTASAKSATPIYATVSRKSEIDTELYLEALCHAFPLSWSHYVRLLSVEKPEARAFYETESLRGGWSVRQLDRQVSTLFYERTALAKNKAKLLTTGAKARSEDAVSVEEEIKSPFVLEFLGLRDDYAENDLEDSLVRHLEAFLLELGNDFTFVARQKKIRVGKQWYRIDLLLFHRRLRCLFIFDLKLGRFTHADAGQMNLYVNYAAEHLSLADENPPVGLILCSEHDEAVARYSMGNLTNKILAAQYKLALPDPRLLEKEIEKTRRMLESRMKLGYKSVVRNGKLGTAFGKTK